MTTDPSDIAKLIDHTLLRPDATIFDIGRLCEEARHYGFHSICVNPFFLPAAKKFLAGSVVRLGTVVGFPLGMNLPCMKVCEAIEASLSGADEIDIVMNIGMAKSGRWDETCREISDIILATRGLIHKIIIETCYLTDVEKVKASEIVTRAGAEFIKTSTGLGPAGASAEDVRLIRSVVLDRCGIKASGGIRTLYQVMDLIDAGATRMGTSSGVKIMEESADEKKR
jgi:deoxyribose-phosphate aldolase